MRQRLPQPRRWLFNLAVGGSSVLFVATMALWTHSFFATIAWNTRERGVLYPATTLRTHRGSLWYAWTSHPLYVEPFPEVRQPDFAGLHTGRLRSSSVDLRFMTGWSFA